MPTLQCHINNIWINVLHFIRKLETHTYRLHIHKRSTWTTKMSGKTSLVM